MAFVKKQNETFFVIFKYGVLWRKSKDAGDLFCTFSSFGPRPIIRDPNNRKLRGPIMILKCTTTQESRLAFGNGKELWSLESEKRDERFWAANIFLQIVLLWILVLKFILITLSVAICEICSQEDGDEGTLSKHHEVEFREKWWQGNNALDYPQCKAEKECIKAEMLHIFSTLVVVKE